MECGGRGLDDSLAARFAVRGVHKQSVGNQPNSQGLGKIASKEHRSHDYCYSHTSHHHMPFDSAELRRIVCTSVAYLLPTTLTRALNTGVDCKSFKSLEIRMILWLATNAQTTPIANATFFFASSRSSSARVFDERRATSARFCNAPAVHDDDDRWAAEFSASKKSRPFHSLLLCY